MISRNREFSSVSSIFSYTLESSVSIMTLHSPFSDSHTWLRLLMPWAHLYTSNGGTSESEGLIHAGKRCVWSA